MPRNEAAMIPASSHRPARGSLSLVTTDDSHQTKRSRRRLSVIGFGALAVMSTISIGSWLYVAHGVADAIEVGWIGPPVCTCTTVKPVDEDGLENVIQARAGMHCAITVRVTNHSDRTVQLGRAIAPTLGSSGAVVKAEPYSGWEPAPDGRGDVVSLAAFVDLDTTLAPGDFMEFDVGVAFRDSGCNSATTVAALDWPKVEIRTLRRTFTISGEDDCVFYGAGRASGCLRMQN